MSSTLQVRAELHARALRCLRSVFEKDLLVLGLLGLMGFGWETDPARGRLRVRVEDHTQMPCVLRFDPFNLMHRIIMGHRLLGPNISFIVYRLTKFISRDIIRLASQVDFRVHNSYGA